MTQANSSATTRILATSDDRSRLDRKVEAIEMLRELALMLSIMADSIEASPISSADWCYVNLYSAQAGSASWQRRVGERLRSWEIEDLRQQQASDL